MALDKTAEKNMITFLEKVLKVLENEKNKTTIEKYISNAKNGLSYMADNEAKQAYLDMALASWLEVAMLFAIREDKLTDELATEYRTFVGVDEYQAKYQEFVAADKEETDRINAEQKVAMDKRRGFEIFQGIINGMSKEEADQKLKEYEEQVAQAMEQVKGA